MKLIRLMACLLLSTQLQAQCIIPFSDFNNFQYVFDGGESHFIEALPLKSVSVARDVMGYIANNSRSKVYYKGKTYPISDNPVQFYTSDGNFAYLNINMIKLLRHNQFEILEGFFRPGMDSLYVTDSLVVWTNFRDELNVYYRDSMYVLEQYPVNRIKAADNLLAYMDRNNNFKVFYRGQLQTLESWQPNNYLADRDQLTYIDQLGYYKHFQNGKLYETSTNETFDYQTAEGMLVWTDQLGQFSVFYNGREEVLMQAKPKRAWIRENIVAWINAAGHFYCFYKGETYWLERYTPEKIMLDNDLIVYRDIDKRLQGFYKGKQMPVSEQIVSDYKIYNQTVSYSLQPYQTTVWCAGKIYTFE